MEKKKVSTTSRPLGMCEKLFNAFNPAFRPLRRLTFRHQEPEGTTNPSSTRPNHSLDSGTKDPGPQKALPTSAKLIPPTSEKKPAETVAPKAEPHHPLPTPAAPPPPSPPTTSVPVRRVPDKVVPPSAAPPKAVTIPQPMPPKAVATPQPLPQPAPPAGAAAATERSKKNINERVEDYIKRRKHKMRVGSGVGRDGSGK
ncbi:vegetative cell wall protein gp1-like [Phoenix dactylifera]|uniref:Vegetative cell wall protein gp1-like n=1 Tax=Phoenix dactylifera TaxID=42345 RepID=A0A8B7CUZ6_PHODC|nr:vegetative cell wall protein gp1-like [Phoenix dactylifera]